MAAGRVQCGRRIGLVVLLPQLTGMSSADLSRVVQGTITGIGFIGGGVILKLSEQHQIVGVTTAASLWLTATVGIAAGTGRLGLAVVGAILALVSRLPVVLAYQEAQASHSHALKRELAIKGLSRQEKEAMILPRADSSP